MKAFVIMLREWLFDFYRCGWFEYYTKRLFRVMFGNTVLYVLVHVIVSMQTFFQAKLTPL